MAPPAAAIIPENMVRGAGPTPRGVLKVFENGKTGRSKKRVAHSVTEKNCSQRCDV